MRGCVRGIITGWMPAGGEGVGGSLFVSVRPPGLGPGSTPRPGGRQEASRPPAARWTPEQVRGDGVGGVAVLLPRSVRAGACTGAFCPRTSRRWCCSWRRMMRRCVRGIIIGWMPAGGEGFGVMACLAPRRHPLAGGDPYSLTAATGPTGQPVWIPAFAGMTVRGGVTVSAELPLPLPA